jgi:hypothetical protein
MSAGAARSVVLAGVVFCLAIAGLVVPVSAQGAGSVELRAEERERELAAVPMPAQPLLRHLVAGQELAVWLPESFAPVDGFDRDASGFARADDGLTVQLSRRESPPGESIFQLSAGAVERLRRREGDVEVASLRRTRVAQRPAVEVTGTLLRRPDGVEEPDDLDAAGDPADGEEPGAGDGLGADHESSGEPGVFRLVVVADAEEGTHRTIYVEAPEGAGPAVADAVLRQVLRDWSPLDGAVWSAAFERQRRSVVDGGASIAWDQRNALFDAIAAPEALGETWVAERLAELSQTAPTLLVDGFLHAHPRVRIGCAEALDPLALPETARARLYALVLQDGDAAVRFRVARRLAALTAVAAETVDHLLETDSAEARSGALQLLAGLTPEERATRLLAAWSKPESLPEATAPLVAMLLARWVPAEQASAELYKTWRRSRDEALREVALDRLLDLGHPEALDLARRRLGEAAAAGTPTLPAAARAVAVFASPEDQEALEDLRDGLAAAADQAATTDGIEDGEALAEDGGRTADEAADEAADELGEALETLDLLLVHFAALRGADGSEAGGGEDEAAVAAAFATTGECADLAKRAGAPWATRRWVVRGCSGSAVAELVRLSISRPGELGSSLLDLLGQLQLAGSPYHETFHVGLGIVLEKLDRWAGDPVSMTSTGIDLSAPLGVAMWPEGSLAGGDSGSGGSRLTLRAADPERALDSLVRLAAGRSDLPDTAKGLMALQALPLLPAAMVVQWKEEHDLRAGEGVDTAAEAPQERWVALAVDPAAGAGDGQAATLFEIGFDSDRQPVWVESRIDLVADRLTLAHAQLGLAPPPLPAAPAVTPAAAADATSRLDVDLTGLLTLAAGGGEGESRSAAIPAGLRLVTETALGGSALRTRLEVSGLLPAWLAVAADAPAATLRAPAELLPADTFTWLSLRFDPAALRTLLEQERERVTAGLGENGHRKLLAATGFLLGEVGLAVVGIPEPGDGTAKGAWENRLVVWLSVEPEEADRFLSRELRRGGRQSGVRLYRWEDEVVARIGGFLVLAADPEVFRDLAKAPFLASAPAWQEVVARSPAEVALIAGFDTDLLADTLRGYLDGRGDTSVTAMTVEGMRALGRIGAWLRRDGEALAGEVAASPRLQSAEARERLRELSSWAGYTSGSVATEGWPEGGPPGLPVAELELTLRLPESAADPGFAWSSERLLQKRLGEGAYRIFSRPGVPLPERSGVRLPISAPEVQPFVRNEHNLNLDVDEVRALAASIRGDETDPARIVRAIVDWAHESLEYSVIRRSPSVEEILATRKADCTEFTQLTIALARSLGIPARQVTGLHVAGDAAILHAWSEVYLDRWYEVDSTFGIVAVPAAHLRLPTVDGGFLAALPGALIVVEGVRDEDGVWRRRGDDGGD